MCVFPGKLWPMRTNVLETRKWQGRREVVNWGQIIDPIHHLHYNQQLSFARSCLKIYKTTYSKFRLDSFEQRGYGAESWIGFNNIF